jgi:excisionase family DNA binding protein
MDKQRDIENERRPTTPTGMGPQRTQRRSFAPTERPLLSPEELAAYLGVPLATVYRWRSRREGPLGMRVGRHVRYRLSDVERWLEERLEERS